MEVHSNAIILPCREVHNESMIPSGWDVKNNMKILNKEHVTSFAEIGASISRCGGNENCSSISLTYTFKVYPSDCQGI
jgi:hypothetical protein